MLQLEYIALVKYRLEKAMTDLKSAQENLANTKFGISVNRSYYAMFHATRALLATKKLDSKRHSSIIGMFNKEFCATGSIDSKFNAILSKAFQIRMKCDYDDFYVVNIDEAIKQCSNAEIFLDVVMAYLKSTYPEIDSV